MARPRILFLFNHDAAHQAAHIAGIAAELALRQSEIEVIAATGTAAIAATVRRIVPAQAHGAISWVDLSLPNWLNALLGPANSVAPVRRLARLRHNIDLFASVDMIVSTERTCLRVRRRLRARMGEAAPLFAYVPHGSGDRNVAYHPELSQFDLFLLSGRKLVDEMVAHGITSADNCRLIGYPKFDTIDRAARPRFFDNDRPTIVYNPHFDPHLSSWFTLGPDILRLFAGQPDRFNLIFAPHVMLFRKRLHISPEYRIAKLRPDIPPEVLDAPNIRIDTGGPRLFDMSYTLGADAYLGDMSSQIYEFLIRPRACFFLDVHSGTAPGLPPPYEFWRNGPVVASVTALADLLPDWKAIARRYRPVQERLMAHSIADDPAHSASERGAAALTEAISWRRYALKSAKGLN
ncbi:MAG: hypothetical protein ABW039_11015 [Sphingobium sp.]